MWSPLQLELDKIIPQINPFLTCLLQFNKMINLKLKSLHPTAQMILNHDSTIWIGDLLMCTERIDVYTMDIFPGMMHPFFKDVWRNSLRWMRMTLRIVIMYAIDRWIFKQLIRKCFLCKPWQTFPLGRFIDWC